MEERSFRLLVVAIVVIALLFVFFQFIAPYFLWPYKPQEEIETRLKIAEAKLGTYTTKELILPKEFATDAKAFDTASRSVVFECNNLALCCNKGKSCPKVIEWDNSYKGRYIKVKESKRLKVSARCRFEKLFICKVYVGEEPAQLSLQGVSIEPENEINLAQSKYVTISFKVKNTGKKSIIAVEPIAKIYIKEIEQGSEQTKWIFIEEQRYKTFPLSVDEEHSGQIQVRLRQVGKYKIHFLLREQTDETNYQEYEFEIKAHGLASLEECIPSERVARWYEEDKCRYFLQCDACDSISRCAQLWAQMLEVNQAEFTVWETNGKVVLYLEGKSYVPEACETPCENDLFFIIDATESMNYEMDRSALIAEKIIEALNENNCLHAQAASCPRIGLYIISGQSLLSEEFTRCEGIFPRDCEAHLGFIPLTNDYERIRQVLVSLESRILPVTRDAESEPWFDVLKYVLQNNDIGWRENARKTVVILTDANDNGSITSLDEALQIASENKVRLYFILPNKEGVKQWVVFPSQETTILKSEENMYDEGVIASFLEKVKGQELIYYNFCQLECFFRKIVEKEIQRECKDNTTAECKPQCALKEPEEQDYITGCTSCLYPSAEEMPKTCETAMQEPVFLGEHECYTLLTCNNCASVEECKQLWEERLDRSLTVSEYAQDAETITLTVRGSIEEESCSNECPDDCYCKANVVYELEDSSKPIDLFIILDASFSMLSEIEAVKQTLQELWDQLKRENCMLANGEPCVRISIYVMEGTSSSLQEISNVFTNLGDFHDKGDRDIGLAPFSNANTELTALINAIGKIESTGGIEPWGNIIIDALRSSKVGWRSDSQKVILVITDVGLRANSSITHQEIAQALRSANAELYGIVCDSSGEISVCETPTDNIVLDFEKIRSYGINGNTYKYLKSVDITKTKQRISEALFNAVYDSISRIKSIDKPLCSADDPRCETCIGKQCAKRCIIQ